MPEVEPPSGEKRETNITRIIRSFMLENENSPDEDELVRSDETESVVPPEQLQVCPPASDGAFSDDS